jgi:hypothetical protein
MRTQKHNQGELKEVKVMIEKDVVESLETMARNSSLSMAEIVVIALKRFRSSHTDYLQATPATE